MREIIDGKMYDTEKARCVGTYENGYSPRDFKHYEEGLYRTKSGKYFLSGHGGGLTKYAERCGDMRCGGRKIIPLSLDEAREWGEENLYTDEYIAEFGEPEEAAEDDRTDDSVKVTIAILPDTLKHLNAESVKTGKSIGAIINSLVAKI